MRQKQDELLSQLLANYERAVTSKVIKERVSKGKVHTFRDLHTNDDIPHLYWNNNFDDDTPYFN